MFARTAFARSLVSHLRPRVAPRTLRMRLSTAAAMEPMGSASQVAEVCDNVIKSAEDQRDYRALQLGNGLRVLLVSDPTTDKSAAALCVNAGHLMDPWEIPGLAHFCEHMLFMGTDTFPSENEYSKFLSEHGGGSNAFTACDQTNYFFDVAPDHLGSVLDRFSQFFICPLFAPSAVDREVNAVDSEHHNYVQQDTWRLAQLERTLSDQTHDYAKFGTGTRETIIQNVAGLDAREELLKFHAARYSSNRMGLCVLGKETLDELQGLIVPQFSAIQNLNLPEPIWEAHPYGKEQLGKLIKVVPVKDLRSLHISFPIPDYSPHFKTAPSQYVSHLLGHEGEGSLLSELKRRGWCSELAAGAQNPARGFGFFSVDLDLSEDGQEHVSEILQLLFEYVAMVKKAGPLEWIFRECEALKKIGFRFKDKENPQSYAMMLAMQMFKFPLHELLSGRYTMTDYDPALITQVVDALTPDNMSVAFISKKFEGKTDKTEKWYGTHYSVEELPSADLDRYRSSEPPAYFTLPEKNEFIPTNFDIHATGDSSQTKYSLPEMLLDEPLRRVWFLQDREFRLPKCCSFLFFSNPLVSVDPLHADLAAVLAETFKDSLTEYIYNAGLAGLRDNFGPSRYGFALEVTGYNEKQPVFIQRLMEKLVSFKPDAQRFAIIKENIIRDMQNFRMEQPYTHAMYFTGLVLAEKVWSKEELLESMKDVTLEALVDFLPRFLSSMHIEALVHGNATSEIAQSIVDVVQNTISSAVLLRPLFASQLQRNREVKLPDACAYKFVNVNEVHPNSALELYLQCGIEDTRDNMRLELVAQIMQEPAFDTLRTKEQLGYIVHSGLRRVNGSQGLRIIVQSEKHPAFVEQRVESFLLSFVESLTTMNEEEWQRHKTALKVKRMERPKKLSVLARRYWGEITGQMYNFTRDETEVACLETITRQELLDYYQNLIASSGAQRHKMCTHIIGTKAASEPAEISPAGDAPVCTKDCEAIEDIYRFKSALPLFPLPQPYIPIAERGVKAKL